MLNGKLVAVVIPAYNEETQIVGVLNTMPKFVDNILVINDCSTDKTKDVVQNYIKNKKLPDNSNRLNAKIGDLVMSNEEIHRFVPFELIFEPKQKVILVNLKKNSGAGAAVGLGYKISAILGFSCVGKMDGDGQMDPSELESLCLPIVNGEVDFVKGNRLIHSSAWLIIPKIRYIGNSILSILTKIASGYWHVSDTQTGYVAISEKALKSLRLFDIYPRYGYPNDLLVKLNIAFCKIREVEIRPVYNVGEKSKMKIHKVIPKISILLIRSFFKRLWLKYFFRDFHPLFLLYHFSFFLAIMDIPFIYRIVKAVIYGEEWSFGTLLFFTFLSISSFQSLLFAMWMDIQDNERLYK
ncbi:glycosyl transferase family 2 [Leptospira ryugenii]|uniref:Glycosyl transferase family 2 n=1 Tax=Leptospira ryugenii TaxID=1917863 RepID=A0A2P2DW15_9LEPT|nr:glycosyltransferase family 2 protein [Leptospira ryugenii]GBF48797.1 glycosyl transferase family 2 [Leptospira ryugenii]